MTTPASNDTLACIDLKGSSMDFSRGEPSAISQVTKRLWGEIECGSEINRSDVDGILGAIGKGILNGPTGATQGGVPAGTWDTSEIWEVWQGPKCGVPLSQKTIQAVGAGNSIEGAIGVAVCSIPCDIYGLCGRTKRNGREESSDEGEFHCAE